MTSTVVESQRYRWRDLDSHILVTTYARRRGRDGGGLPEGFRAGGRLGRAGRAGGHDPPEMPAAQLQSESPSIEFSKDNSYVIMWGGKALSHGTFTTDGMNIRIKENLPDGTTRAFPFWVSELTDKEIVFATLGQDGSKATAVKE